MFEQSKLKIAWANQHIRNLDSYIKYLSGNLHTLTIEKNPQTGLAEVRCRILPSETEIPLFVGDIAHNLHSAIDILFCDILRHEDIGVSEFSKWPFRKNQHEVEGALNGSKSKLSSGIIDLIVNEIQIYQGGKGEDLYGLHDLNIEDKHMLLTPIFNITYINNIQYLDKKGNSGIISGSISGQGGVGNPSIKGAAFGGGTGVDIVEIKNHGEATLHVCFREGAFRNQLIVPKLHKLSEIVSKTVDQVEKFLVAQASN